MIEQIQKMVIFCAYMVDFHCPGPIVMDMDYHYTVYRELFTKENFRDMSIVTVFVRKRSRI